MYRSSRPCQGGETETNKEGRAARLVTTKDFARQVFLSFFEKKSLTVCRYRQLDDLQYLLKVEQPY